jgi:hypothetical protein
MAERQCPIQYFLRVPGLLADELNWLRTGFRGSVQKDMRVSDSVEMRAGGASRYAA